MPPTVLRLAVLPRFGPALRTGESSPGRTATGAAESATAH